MSNPIKDSLKAKDPEQEATAPEIHPDQVPIAHPEVQASQPAPKTDKAKPKLRVNKKNVAVIAGSVLTAVALLGGGLERSKVGVPFRSGSIRSCWRCKAKQSRTEPTSSTWHFHSCRVRRA